MRLLVRALLLAALIPSPAQAQQAGLPAELQLPLLVNVLSFDRGLPASAEIVIAVVYQREVVASMRVRDAWVQAAAQAPAAGATARRVVPIEYHDPQALLQALRDCGATVVYLSKLRAVDMSALAERVRRDGFRTASGEAALAERTVAIGLLLRDNRPRVVINRTLAEREGSNFSSQLLRVAEVLQ